jgi:hypothetical protein
LARPGDGRRRGGDQPPRAGDATKRLSDCVVLGMADALGNLGNRHNPFLAIASPIRCDRCRSVASAHTQFPQSRACLIPNGSGNRSDRKESARSQASAEHVSGLPLLRLTPSTATTQPACSPQSSAAVFP